MKISETKFIGHFRHVIRLNYPCGNSDDAKAPHGEPPTLEIIATVLKTHREGCDYCRKD